MASIVRLKIAFSPTSWTQRTNQTVTKRILLEGTVSLVRRGHHVYGCQKGPESTVKILAWYRYTGTLRYVTRPSI